MGDCTTCRAFLRSTAINGCSRCSRCYCETQSRPESVGCLRIQNSAGTKASIASLPRKYKCDRAGLTMCGCHRSLFPAQWRGIFQESGRGTREPVRENSVTYSRYRLSGITETRTPAWIFHKFARDGSVKTVWGLVTVNNSTGIMRLTGFVNLQLQLRYQGEWFIRRQQYGGRRLIGDRIWL